jgi:hypothetical protein
LVPASFLISENPLFIGWFQLLGTFTMYPLLKRDGLAIPYVVCCLLYVCLLICLRLEQQQPLQLLNQQAVSDTSAVPNHVSSSVKGVEDGLPLDDGFPLPQWALKVSIGLSCFGE